MHKIHSYKLQTASYKTKYIIIKLNFRRLMVSKHYFIKHATVQSQSICIIKERIRALHETLVLQQCIVCNSNKGATDVHPKRLLAEGAYINAAGFNEISSEEGELISGNVGVSLRETWKLCRFGQFKSYNISIRINNMLISSLISIQQINQSI